MKPSLLLVRLPAKMMVITPVITSSVVKAAHGQRQQSIPRLDRAIAHTQLLLDELKSVRTVLARTNWAGQAPEPDEAQRDASLEEIRAALAAIERRDAVA